MCTEIATFDVDIATENQRLGSGVGYDWGVEYIKQLFKYHMPHTAHSMIY